MREAEMKRTPEGLEPVTEGWFVVNLAEAAWRRSERFGSFCRFESTDVPEARFPQLGVNVHVLEPGTPACMYHRESVQEAFLVLHGECRLLVEGEERILRAWDFFHCPPGTDHVFVGGSDGPCTVLMMGVRDPAGTITYPVSALAQSHGAGVARETHDGREAYAGVAPSRPTADRPWPPGSPARGRGEDAPRA